MNEFFNPCTDNDWDDELPETESYRHTFRDGSVILVNEFDAPDVELPHRKTSRLWMAEEVANHAEENQMDQYETIKYIKEYENRD